MTIGGQSSLQCMELYAAPLKLARNFLRFKTVIAFQQSKTTTFFEKQSLDDELSCLLIFQRNQNTLAVRCRRKSSVNTVAVTANPSQGLQGTEKVD